MGGEKRCLCLLLTLQCGSPPHGRGKVFVHQVSPLDVGITPAWAGKRVLSSNCWFFAQDHPRMGGEKSRPSLSLFLGVGSPPHGRGKVLLLHHLCKWRRITPAWAGKSARRVDLSDEDQDHPRMGGEKQSGRAGKNRLHGSPPHGRGKGRLSILSSSATGITPAWAGKSMLT